MKRAALACVALLACGKPAIVPDEKPVEPRVAHAPDASAIATTLDAGAAPPTESSPFVGVARVARGRVQRVTGSPVLAVDEDANLLWELGEGGTPKLVEPLAERVIASERGPFINIGRIAGRWPTVYVELGFGTGRGESTIHNYAVDVAKGTVTRSKMPWGHLASSSPWIDGTELGWASEDTSRMSSWGVARGGDFVVVSGPKRALPKVPKTLTAPMPTIAAYESGRIFVLASVERREPDYDVDEKVVWSFDAKGGSPMALPGKARHLLRGRREDETLVAGELRDDTDERHDVPPFLVRFDGAAWTPITLPFRDPIRSIATADDGSVWIASGGLASPRRGGEVWRATLPELRFARVPIGAGLVPLSIAATTAKDVWLVADEPSNPIGALLLHTQASAPAKVEPLVAEPVEVARLVLGRREPAAYTSACAFPFLALGKEAEVAEADVVAFGKDDPEWAWSQHALLVRLPSGEKLWGTELYASYPKPLSEDVSAATALLKRARARIATAKLLCTALPVEREVQVKPEPPRPPPRPRGDSPPPGPKKK